MIESCPDSTYEINSQCKKCPDNCSSCTSSSSCTSCIDTHYLYQGSCRNDCPSYTYKNQTQCSNCPEHCISCKYETILKCTECDTDYIKYSHRCYNSSIYNRLNSPDLRLYEYNSERIRRKIKPKERY